MFRNNREGESSQRLSKTLKDCQYLTEKCKNGDDFTKPGST